MQFSSPARPSFGGPQAIGYALFTDYLLPFQLLALLLLAAMVGVIVLTHRQMTPIANRIGVRRRVSRPLVNVITAQVGHDVTDNAAERIPADEAEIVGS
ncbi:MAG: NADH-quinone oxidoreductase subunit J [Anaerolineae bacterium]|nr:NADH-quinone oxidoreductase subunit J [Anaerolineae bacterium]